jgi:hypothetical protein
VLQARRIVSAACSHVLCGIAPSCSAPQDDGALDLDYDEDLDPEAEAEAEEYIYRPGWTRTSTRSASASTTTRASKFVGSSDKVIDLKH